MFFKALKDAAGYAISSGPIIRYGEPWGVYGDVFAPGCFDESIRSIVGTPVTRDFKGMSIGTVEAATADDKGVYVTITLDSEEVDGE